MFEPVQGIRRPDIGGKGNRQSHRARILVPAAMMLRHSGPPKLATLLNHGDRRDFWPTRMGCARRYRREFIQRRSGGAIRKAGSA